MILAILEKRKSLFPWFIGFPDHHHTVEVAGSNPMPPNELASKCELTIHVLLREGAGVLVPDSSL